MEKIGLGQIFIFSIAFLMYFFPAYVGRNHKKFYTILLVNLATGWTIVGWIGALIWGLMDEGGGKTESNNNDEVTPFKEKHREVYHDLGERI